MLYLNYYSYGVKTFNKILKYLTLKYMLDNCTYKIQLTYGWMHR